MRRRRLRRRLALTRRALRSSERKAQTRQHGAAALIGSTCGRSGSRERFGRRTWSRRSPWRGGTPSCAPSRRGRRRRGHGAAPGRVRGRDAPCGVGLCAVGAPRARAASPAEPQGGVGWPSTQAGCASAAAHAAALDGVGVHERRRRGLGIVAATCGALPKKFLADADVRGHESVAAEVRGKAGEGYERGAAGATAAGPRSPQPGSRVPGKAEWGGGPPSGPGGHERGDAAAHQLSQNCMPSTRSLRGPMSPTPACYGHTCAHCPANEEVPARRRGTHAAGA